MPNFNDIGQAIEESNDVQFFWALVSVDWEEEKAQAWLSVVVDSWITIRNFSYTSSWVEKFKAAQKKSVQKLKDCACSYVQVASTVAERTY